MNFQVLTQAILLAIQTPHPSGFIGIPCLLWGKPGQGKSSFLEGLARTSMPVETIIAAIHDPTDFTGLPINVEGKVRYAAPEWVDTFKQDGILFLDEISTAPPAVQAALMRVVLERKVGYHQLPNGVRIVAAANPPDDIIGGWDLSPPLANRFLHFDWELPHKNYITGIRNGFPKMQLPHICALKHAEIHPSWQARVANFLEHKPDLLNTNPEEGALAFASPRTWDYAIALMSSFEVLYGSSTLHHPLVFKLLKACIGLKAGTVFYEHLVSLKIPNAFDLLAGKKRIKLTRFNDSELETIWNGMTNKLIEELDGKNLLPFSINFMKLTKRVFEHDKKDVVYISIKRLMEQAWIPKLLSAAHIYGLPSSVELKKTIIKTFDDEDFNEIAAVLEKVERV